MSVEAYTWALNLAPVPTDSTGKPNSACAFVLVGLANNAGSDGKDAFPSVDTLVRYTRLSERTVRTALDRLEKLGTIKKGDPAIVAARIKRADQRPQNYDLQFDQMRDDLTDRELDKIGKDNPWLKPWIEQKCAERGATTAPRERGATTAPRSERGATDDSNGVQPTQERGAAAAPEPYLEPSTEPSTTNTPPSPSLRSVSDESDGQQGFALEGLNDDKRQDDEPAPVPASSFEDFWKAYPRHIGGKLAAEKAWKRALTKASAEVIVAGAVRFAADPNLPLDPQFIAYPTTWLNGGRWDDEVMPPRRGGPFIDGGSTAGTDWAEAMG